MGSFSRRTLLGLGLGASVAAGLSSCATAPSPEPSTPAPQPSPTGPLPAGQAWAHLVPHGLPDYLEPGAPPYGETYPLDLIAGDHTAPPRPSSGVPRAQQAGLTGLHILQLESAGNSGTDFVIDWMEHADATWASGSLDGLSIAPCMSPLTTAGFGRMAREYAAGAVAHRSAARIDGRLVVFVYAARALSLADWRLAREALTRDGVHLYIVGDLQPEASQNAGGLARAEVQQYARLFDAVWAFDDLALEISPQMAALATREDVPLAGTVMPGYNRETENGGIIDPEGTRRFRASWEAQLADRTPWVVGLTWNDAVEHTDIKAGSMWNHTRQDVNRFYADRLRGRTASGPANLYLSSVSHVWPGEPLRAEGLVLNPSDAAVTVTMRLLDANGRPVGSSARATVAAHSAGDATVRVPTSAPRPGPTFLRAAAELRDASGHLLAQVTGAPILVYRSPQEAGRDRQDWYSIPAARSLPRPVRLAVAPDRRSATVDSPGTDARFIELLQNTRSAGRLIDAAASPFPIPVTRSTIVGPQDVTIPASGFYVGRVISTDERVGYSDPIWLG